VCACGRVAAVAEKEACTCSSAAAEEEEAGSSGVDGGGGDWRSTREHVAGT
jgi:hypothetical protein